MLKNEKQIWSQIRNGDVDAYRYLFELFYKELYLYARKFLANKEVAEEIAQDVYISLWENRDNVHIDKSVKSYLYTSVKNRSINYLKSKINNIDFVPVDEVVRESNTLPADKMLELSELDALIIEAVEMLH